MKKIYLSIIFIQLLLVVLCSAAAAPEEWDFSGGILDREESLALAATATVEAYPDADIVLVDSAVWFRYRPDGTYVKWGEKYIRMMTEKGRRKYRTISSYFTIPYQRGPEDCKIPLLEIIKPDGTVLPVDMENQSKIMVNPSSMRNNIYNPNSKIIRVNVAGLEVGDILHYVMYDRIVHPRVPDSWCDRWTFESAMPILRSFISIYAPKELPLQSIALKGEIEDTVTREETEKDGIIHYQWEARNIPRFFSEPKMPSPPTVLQRLLVSTFPDWETVSRWYWELSAPHLETTPAIEAKVAELTDGLEDPREKIEAIFKFVSQKIRYLGVIAETTSPGYEPHDVESTFEERHGVCRDKAALLAAMLRLAGFEAYPTLIYTGPKKDPEVPQPFFNHAITAVREDDGSFLLMDSTNEITAVLLPANLSDKSYLVATPAGEDLRTSPIDPAANNLMRVETTGSLDRDGKLMAETVFHFDGINDNAYRRSFSRKKPEERRRYFEALLKNAGGSARVEKVTIEPADLMDTTRPLAARVEYSIDDLLISGENAVMFPLPAIGLGVGLVNRLIGSTGLEERRFPLRTGIACGLRERIEIELDPSLGEAVFMPEGEPINNEALSWKFTTRQTGNTLEQETDFRLKTLEFSPAEYLELKETLKQIERELRQKPIFSGPEESEGEESIPAADILMLEDVVNFNLTDQQSWTSTRSVKKKVLTYSGKKQSGELKFTYNPVWKKINLDYAKVTNPDGSVREVSEEDINLMDASWVGSAPRYPGEKIMVVSLPRLEIGSIIEYCYTSICWDHPFFSTYNYFQLYSPVEKSTLALEVPADLPLTIFPDEVENISLEKFVPEGDKTRVLYRWTAEDLPALKQERGVPPRWSFLPTIFISSGNWKTYAGEVSDVLTMAATDQPESKKKARSLVEGVSDPWKRLEIIRDFIVLNVRKAGPGINSLPLSSVTGADRTLKDGYGNRTDRGVLYYTMLKAAGFSPVFVLASSRPMIDRFVDIYRKAPNEGLFSTILIRVDDGSLGLEAGRAVYLNDTNQYAAIGATPREGKIALTLPGGRLKEIRPSRETSSEYRMEMEVAEDGDAVVSVKRLLWGNNYGGQKKFYAELTPEKRRRFYQEVVGEFSKAARAAGELITDFTGYPGRIEYAVMIPDYAVPAGDYLYFFRSSGSPLFNLSSDSRTSPLYLSGRKRKNNEISIELPPGFAVDYLPESLERDGVAGAALDLDFSFRSEPGRDDSPGRIVIRSIQSLDPSIVEPGRYRELLDIYREMIDRKFKLIILRRLPGEDFE